MSLTRRRMSHDRKATVEIAHRLRSDERRALLGYTSIQHRNDGISSAEERLFRLGLIEDVPKRDRYWRRTNLGHAVANEIKRAAV